MLDMTFHGEWKTGKDILKNSLFIPIFFLLVPYGEVLLIALELRG